MKFQEKQQAGAPALRQRQLFPYVLLLLMALAEPALANWRIFPQIGVGAEYDSNSRLTPDGISQSASGFGANVQATFFYESPLTDLTLTPELRFTAFDSGNESLDSNDQFLEFRFNHLRQRANFRVRGDLSNESVRTAERSPVDFDIDDPDEIPDDDSARVFDTNKRQRIKIVPEFRYDITERFAAGLRVRFRDVGYDNTTTSGLNEYTDTRLEGIVDYKWTPKDTFSLTAYGRRYELDSPTPTGVTDISGSGFTLGYSRALSQRTRVSFDIGGDTTESQTGQDETNPIGRFSIVHQLLRTRIIGSYQRNVAGGGSGQLSLRDAISLNFSRDVTEKLVVSGGARIYRTDSIDSVAAALNDRDYMQLRALMDLRLSRSFSVQFDYRYTRVDREVAVTDADSNQFNIWVNWHPGRPVNQ